MEHLDEIFVDGLQQALDETEGKRPTQRQVATVE